LPLLFTFTEFLSPFLPIDVPTAMLTVDEPEKHDRRDSWYVMHKVLVLP